MKVKELQVEIDEVKHELKNLKKGIKAGYLSKRNKLTRELMGVYGHLRYGGKIIDLFASLNKAGLRKDCDCPKLAVIRADYKRCYLHKKKNGSAIFTGCIWRWDSRVLKEDVKTPPETFAWADMTNQDYRCVAPIIPPRINVEISARIIPQNYYIIFEVESWLKVAPPVDPILTKRLTSNLFGVIATWDLTKLERSLVLGR